MTVDNNRVCEIMPLEGCMLRYHRDNVRVYQGDCRNLLPDVLEGDLADMIFADPPYNLSNGGITCHAGKMVSVNKGAWDKSAGVHADHEFILEWLAACRDSLKANGTIWVSGTRHVIFSVGYAMQELGFKLLNEISWFKPNASPNLSCRYFTHSHETLIWAARDDKAKHYFDYRANEAGSRWQADALGLDRHRRR